MIARRTLLWFVIAVAMIAGALLWKHPTSPARQTPTAPSVAGSATASAPRPAGTGKTRRLSPEEREQLGAQIAAAVHKAREARAAQARAAGSAVPDEDPVIPLESVGPELK
ncbi:MAG TPA: hypothetical protein VIV58_37850, partial [Kofleriaceae bacterium]